MSDHGSNGAQAPREVTLPDSGRQVRIKFVGPLLMNDIRKAVKRAVGPKPAPPMQEVDYGNGTKKTEPNPLHPEYEAAVQEWTVAQGQVLLEKLLRYGVEAEMDEADQARLAELRADPDLELPADDRLAFLTRIVAGTERDQEALQDAILGRAQPTDKAVADALATFRGDVPGA
jgi:hypothetical protein